MNGRKFSRKIMLLKCSINFGVEEPRTVSFSANGCKVPLKPHQVREVSLNKEIVFCFVYAGISYCITGNVKRIEANVTDNMMTDVAIHFDSITWDIQNLFKTF